MLLLAWSHFNSQQCGILTNVDSNAAREVTEEEAVESIITAWATSSWPTLIYNY